MFYICYNVFFPIQGAKINQENQDICDNLYSENSISLFYNFLSIQPFFIIFINI